MGSQALEQMLESAPLRSKEQSGLNQTIDSYLNGTTALYSFDFNPAPLSLNHLDIRPMDGPYLRPLEPLKKMDFDLYVDKPLINLDKDPLIKPSYGGVVIPHPKIPGIPALHDTYKLDRYDNLYKGHTTINLPGDEKLRLDHNY